MRDCSSLSVPLLEAADAEQGLTVPESEAQQRHVVASSIVCDCLDAARSKIVDWWTLSTCKGFLSSRVSRNSWKLVMLFQACFEVHFFTSVVVGVPVMQIAWNAALCVTVAALPPNTLLPDLLLATWALPWIPTLIALPAHFVSDLLAACTAAVLFFGIAGLHSSTLLLQGVVVLGSLLLNEAVTLQTLSLTIYWAAVSLPIMAMLEYQNAKAWSELEEQRACKDSLLDLASSGFGMIDSTGCLSSVSPKLSNTFDGEISAGSSLVSELACPRDRQDLLDFLQAQSPVPLATSTGKAKQRSNLIVTCQTEKKDFEVCFIPYKRDHAGQVGFCVQILGEVRCRGYASSNSDGHPQSQKMSERPSPRVLGEAEEEEDAASLTLSLTTVACGKSPLPPPAAAVGAAQSSIVKPPCTETAVQTDPPPPPPPANVVEQRDHHAIAATVTPAVPPLPPTDAKQDHERTSSPGSWTAWASTAGKKRHPPEQSAAELLVSWCSGEGSPCVYPSYRVTPLDTLRTVLHRAVRGFNLKYDSGCCSSHMVWSLIKAVAVEELSLGCMPPPLSKSRMWQCSECFAVNAFPHGDSQSPSKLDEYELCFSCADLCRPVVHGQRNLGLCGGDSTTTVASGACGQASYPSSSYDGDKSEDEPGHMQARLTAASQQVSPAPAHLAASPSSSCSSGSGCSPMPSTRSVRISL
mmetsp:Transcript_46885/g.111619  ORF Transcript_46885/g.111619 Transcript_46885/m.111619 type:complete len:694 (+) Transcript_46885:102-2183(+)